MMKNIKRFLFIILGFISELVILGLYVPILLVERLRTKAYLSIFMGMMHINNWTYVAQAIRKKGYKVQVVPWIIPEHEQDVIPYDVNLKRKYPRLYSNFIGQYMLTLWIFVWAICNFDIFIIPFRSRLLDRTVWLGRFEIQLLHLAGKKVILNTYGADVATPRLKRRNDLKYSLYDGYVKDPQYKNYNELAIIANTKRLEKQADHIISAIDHIDYLNRVDTYLHMRCINTELIKPNYETNNLVPLFVHAPNHRLLKGTEQIVEAIHSLNKRGFPCELKIIENTANDQLLQIIKNADAVIDQLILGTYARLAIESMALGKPVFCYLREDLYKYNPIWYNCPIISANPDDIEQKLEDFLKMMPDERINIGRMGRKYIESFHSLEYVGTKLDEILKRVV